MKKYLGLALVFSLMASTFVSAQGVTKYKGYDVVDVKVNGNSLTLDVPAIIMDGRTLLPLRKVSESLNSVVTWDAAAKTASVLKPQVNIIFTQSADGVIASGEPTETIPFWTEYDKFLSYISISGLPAANYSVLCSIYKKHPKDSSKILIDSKPTQEIMASGPNNPVMFSLAWDKAIISEAGVYSFVVSIKDGSGQYQPVAVHTMELV